MKKTVETLRRVRQRWQQWDLWNGILWNGILANGPEPCQSVIIILVVSASRYHSIDFVTVKSSQVVGSSACCTWQWSMRYGLGDVSHRIFLLPAPGKLRDSLPDCTISSLNSPFHCILDMHFLEIVLFVKFLISIGTCQCTRELYQWCARRTTFQFHQEICGICRGWTWQLVMLNVDCDCKGN